MASWVAPLRMTLWSVVLTVMCGAGAACQSASASISRQGSSSSAARAVDQGMRAVTYSRQPMADRRAAVEQMLAEDANGFWADCASLTRQIDDWPMIRLLCEKAAASQDPRALPWLIRSWAMPSKIVADSDRPEREAIEQLTGELAESLLSKLVFHSPEDYAPASQVAAWSVLARISRHEVLRERIQAVPERRASLLVTMLKQAAPALDILPHDRLAIARLMRLIAKYPPAQWRGWAQWRLAHAGDGQARLALRHLPAIERRDPVRDGWGRSQWLKHIKSRLAGRRHAARGSGDDDGIVVRRHPGRFADYTDRFGIADLLVLDELLDAMEDSEVKRVAFAQAEADRLDRSTELGGVVTWNKQGRILLQPFTPLLRRHDQAYIASTPCIDALYLGLAHFHFHTQRYDNTAWAGPGQGDRDFADSHHATAIVLTFLDPVTLNVDAYMPGGISVDLGCMTR